MVGALPSFKTTKYIFMLKLYFKKLLATALYFGLFVLIYFIGFVIFYSISNIFKNQIIHSMVLLGIPFIVIMAVVFNKRVKNLKLEKDYLDNIDNKEKTIVRELKYLKKIPDFWAEMMVFFTLCLPLLIFMSIKSKASLYADIIAGFIIFVIFLVMFLVVYFMHWWIVHTIWLRNQKE